MDIYYYSVGLLSLSEKYGALELRRPEVCFILRLLSIHLSSVDVNVIVSEQRPVACSTITAHPVCDIKKQLLLYARFQKSILALVAGRLLELFEIVPDYETLYFGF